MIASMQVSKIVLQEASAGIGTGLGQAFLGCVVDGLVSVFDVESCI